MTDILKILGQLPAMAEDAGNASAAAAPVLDSLAELAADPATSAAIDRVIAVLEAVKVALPKLVPTARKAAAEMRAFGETAATKTPEIDRAGTPRD